MSFVVTHFESNAELAGFSLDIKSAHKRVVIRTEEQGLLGFQIDGKLFFYRVCPFGATFSAVWWQRVGGWILRFFHLFIWLSHSAFLYVDDYFWIQRKDIIHLTPTTVAMLRRCLGIPIIAGRSVNFLTQCSGLVGHSIFRLAIYHYHRINVPSW